MTEQRPVDDQLPQADKDLDDQGGEESSSAKGNDAEMSDAKPDQIDPDDPQKVQKLTQSGRDYDVDEAEE